MNLILHIERVVLEGPGFDGPGLDGHQRDQLRIRLEHELTRQLAGRPLTAALAGGVAVPRLDGAPVQLDATAPGGLAAHLASQVAGSVATTLTGPAGPSTTTPTTRSSATSSEQKPTYFVASCSLDPGAGSHSVARSSAGPAGPGTISTVPAGPTGGSR